MRDVTLRLAVRAGVLLVIIVVLWTFGLLRTGPPVVY